MKKVLILVLSCLFSSQVSADNGSILRDPFLGPSLKITEINDESAFIGGLRGGWIMNHSYVVGAGLYGLIHLMHKIDAPDEVYTKDKDQRISFLYGGFEAEYIGKWDKRIHYLFHSLIGIGGLSYIDKEDDLYLQREKGIDDGIFVFEPSFNIEVNIRNDFRIDAGVSYRSVTGVELRGLDNSDISGFGTSIVLKFGQYQ